MAPKADPPDFIDSGEYDLTDVSIVWKIFGWVIGAAIAMFAVAVGVGLGASAEDEFSSLTGMQTQNSGSVDIEFGGGN